MPSCANCDRPATRKIKGFPLCDRCEPASPSEQREGEATARVEGLTAEDRARLDELVEMAGRLASIGGFPENVADALTRALAALDHQTKALEAADELAQAVREQIEDEPERLSTASTVAFEVYQATRDRMCPGFTRADATEEENR